ncbi:DUF4397 domain-containing protein [Metabacillus iocasae]|uniref:DUF4397 domain-containing protein n=1 Tax=Priestia iocasae TaxID=2291674 RepID=A0ABS2QUQ0_9BACI|nr:DUF4397 domain-containing protein [Metabacillus iocasae]MBM7703195.1 hypothetical protein [Metabacillus iocasae]
MNYSHFDKYLKKAMKYDFLSNYYKYSDPTLFITYYQKHLHYMQKALTPTSRSYEDREQPMMRILHASPGASSVDVYLNGRRTIRNLTFKQETDYIPLKEEGRYRIDIYPAGQTDKPLLTEDVQLEANRKYTSAVVGTPNDLDLILIADNSSTPEGETKVRFIHLSPNAPAVDIAAKNGDVVFSNISFKEITDYLGLTPMPLDVEVRAAGTDKVVLDVPPVRLRPNRAYTIYAVGLLNGNPPLEALISQD